MIHTHVIFLLQNIGGEHEEGTPTLLFVLVDKSLNFKEYIIKSVKPLVNTIDLFSRR